MVNGDSDCSLAYSSYSLRMFCNCIAVEETPANHYMFTKSFFQYTLLPPNSFQMLYTFHIVTIDMFIPPQIFLKPTLPRSSGKLYLELTKFVAVLSYPPYYRFAGGPQYEEIDEFDDFEDDFDPYGDDSDFEDSSSKRKKSKKKDPSSAAKGSRRSTRGGGHDEEQKPFQCECKFVMVWYIDLIIIHNNA